MRNEHPPAPAMFQLSPDAVDRLTSSLRADSAALLDIPVPAYPAVGPVAPFAHACRDAIASVNERSALLRREADRLSDVMDATTAAALQVDSALGRALMGLRP